LPLVSVVVVDHLSLLAVAIVLDLQPDLPVVVVVLGHLLLHPAQRVLAVHLSKVATHTDTILTGLPKPLVVVAVQAEQVLRRCITTAVLVVLELQVP
jgi:hypothetical protein